MQKNSHRVAVGCILAAAAALSGCGGSNGTKPAAHIRTVDVGTNTIDPSSHVDDGGVLVNGASSTIDAQYGAPTPYLFVEAGSSSFQGTVGTSLPLPSFTDPTTSVVTTATLPIINVNLLDGQNYTAYQVGRRDITYPTSADLTTLDNFHFLNAVVLQDNQPTPASGQSNVRVLIAGPDIPPVDIHVNSAIPSSYTNLKYNPTATTPASADVAINSGATTFSVDATGTSTVIVPPTTLTLASGRNYTLVVTEPTGAASPGNTPAVPPVVTTYGLALVQN